MRGFVFSVLFFVFLLSCSSIEFSYNEERPNNQLYEITSFEVVGDDLPYVNNIVLSKFGIPQERFFHLEIAASEKKTKITIEKNQVSSRVDYEIVFIYNLRNLEKGCVVLKNKQFSRFSFTPKSEGYNFGSDKFLESLYKRNIEDNISQLVNVLGQNIRKKNCLSEN